jgi:hypothetical protein
MSHRPDHLTDEVLPVFLRTRSADPDLGLLDEIMRTVGATPQDRPWLGLRPNLLPRRTLLIVAIALLLATMGAIAVGSRLLQPDLPVERMTVIGQVIDAVNDRDLGSLRSSFAADGTLEIPGVDARAGREGDVFVSDGWRPDEHWMRLVDPWGLEARLGTCRTRVASTISCAVVTRWHVLQVEIGEEWTFDFDGGLVTRLQMVRVDPDPPNRVLPLGLVDLQRWEAWLRVTHPEQADDLLPTGPDPFAHYYFRFGLGASPDEIGASIEEHLESRDPLVGTYVCSEDGKPDVTHLWDVREDGTITRVVGETGEALPAGTWSRDNGRLLTNFEGGMTWFEIQGDRFVIPGGWACTRGSSR